MIPLTKPYFPESTEKAISEVLRSGWVVEGPKVEQFEQMVADFVGADYAVACANCTVGLEMCLRYLKYFGYIEDKVIIPAFTYPATANAVIAAKLKPQFIDVNEYYVINLLTCGFDKSFIMPVSLFGINGFIDDSEETIIEDAACSLGGDMYWPNCKASVFSFHPRKVITTGEGGMIITNDLQMANWLRKYKHFGLGKEKGIFDQHGTNYKMTDIQAVIGIEQMKVIDDIIKKRKAIRDIYAEHFKVAHSFQTVLLEVNKRNFIIRKMKEHNIECGIGSFDLSKMKQFNDNSYYPNADKYDKCLLSLPSYYEMKESEQEEVISKLKIILKETGNEEICVNQ